MTDMLESHHQQWFDATKHPAFDLGFCILPAYMVPVAITLLLPICERKWSKWQRARGEASRTELNKADPDFKTKESRLESQETTKPRTPSPAANPSLSPKMKFLAYVLLMGFIQPTILRYLVNSDPLKGNLEKHPLVVCLPQACFILITGYFFDIDIVACLFAATGWIALAYQWTYSPPPTLPSTIVMALFALPYAFVSTFEPYVGVPAISGEFLLVALIEPFIPPESVLRTKFYFVEVWPPGMCLLIQLARASHYILREFLESRSDTRTTLTTMAKDVFEQVGLVLAASPAVLGIMAVILLPPAVCGVVACYAFTCLSWRWIISECSSPKPPSVATGFLGALLYMLVWIAMSVKRYVIDETTWKFVMNELYFNAVALVRTVAGFTTLWMVVFGWFIYTRAGAQVCV